MKNNLLNQNRKYGYIKNNKINSNNKYNPEKIQMNDNIPYQPNINNKIINENNNNENIDYYDSDIDDPRYLPNSNLLNKRNNPNLDENINISNYNVAPNKLNNINFENYSKMTSEFGNEPNSINITKTKFHNFENNDLSQENIYTHNKSILQLIIYFISNLKKL